jgi:mRNA interferase MazF
MRRGEVWWAQLPEGKGRHPVVLLSRDISYGARSSVTVAEITSTIRGIPVEVPLDSADGMPRECVVNLDNIVTIKQFRLSDRLTMLSPEKMARVRQAIVYALDLREPL